MESGTNIHHLPSCCWTPDIILCLLCVTIPWRKAVLRSPLIIHFLQYSCLQYLPSCSQASPNAISSLLTFSHIPITMVFTNLSQFLLNLSNISSRIKVFLLTPLPQFPAAILDFVENLVHLGSPYFSSPPPLNNLLALWIIIPSAIKPKLSQALITRRICVKQQCWMVWTYCKQMPQFCKTGFSFRKEKPAVGSVESTELLQLVRSQGSPHSLTIPRQKPHLAPWGHFRLASSTSSAIVHPLSPCVTFYFLASPRLSSSMQRCVVNVHFFL